MEIQDESQTVASITLQNLFRLYPKLSGMTGTAMTEEAEFGKIYNLQVTQIPTNKTDIRINHPDVIYKTRQKKYEFVAKEIFEMTQLGRPTLVGTVSIEKSEYISSLLSKMGIRHNILNAKNHEKEAYIIAQAGRLGAVTIATNMAGRGTDILLGGNPEYMAKEELDKNGIFPNHPEYERLKNEALERARELTQKEHDEVVKLGGLHVIGTERHESRRIDNQLRGRAARQGDPGSTKFFLSLEDDLMRIFGGEKIAQLMTMLNVDDDTAIENVLITKQIESAQKKVETYHFDIRKSVLEYDDVMNIQREKFYAQRKKVLYSQNLRDEYKFMIQKETDRVLQQYVSKDMAPQEYVPADLQMLIKEFASIIPLLKDKITVDDIKNLRFNEISEHMQKLALEAYEEMETTMINLFNDVMSKQIGENYIEQKAFESDNIFRAVERDILLRAADAKWTDHLGNVDALKDSIGLVAYGQKDPLIEYKKEAYNLFNSLMGDIQETAVSHLFRARFGIEQIEG